MCLLKMALEQEGQAFSAQNETATRSSAQGDKKQPTKPTKCMFSRVIPIDPLGLPTLEDRI